jgi:hemolysin III
MMPPIGEETLTLETLSPEILSVAPDSVAVPEIWSTRLSFLGAALALPALYFLIAPSIAAHSVTHAVSFSLYGFGILSMFLASGYFHYQAGRERVFSKCLDYGAIGLMIAGNFTPYCAIALRTGLAWRVLAIVWALALTAAGLRIAKPQLSKWYFVSIFLAMGWMGLLLAGPIVTTLGPGGAWLTVLGGVIYTAGTLFFNRFQGDVEPPGFGPHDIWHIFIIAAAGTHYAVLYLYMLPGR